MIYSSGSGDGKKSRDRQRRGPAKPWSWGSGLIWNMQFLDIVIAILYQHIKFDNPFPVNDI